MKKTILIIIFLLLHQSIFPQQITVRLNEGFESITFPPTGWKRINLSGSNTWQRLAAPLPPEIMQPPKQGSAVARINYEYYGGEDWLITKKINSISEGDSLLFFLIKQSDQGPFPPDSLFVKVSVTDSLPNSFEYTLVNINIAALPIGPQVWRKYVFPLTQFAGQNIFIGFKHEDINGHGCAIDSVVVFNSSSIGISKISSNVPERYELCQNYPNPFNPHTKIKFSIPKQGLVTLKVYNLLGQEVALPVNSVFSEGYYNVDFDGTVLPGGVYFYKIESNWFLDTKKMVLIK
jgi:hypothetical protein